MLPFKANEKIEQRKKEKMKYKLLACDLDGTLLEKSGKISEEKLDSIAELCKRGIEFVVVTGRSYAELPQQVLSCENINYIIRSDGAVTIERKQNKVIRADYLDKKTVERSFEILRDYDVMTEVFIGGVPFVDGKKFSDEGIAYYGIDPAYVPIIKETRVPDSDIEKKALLSSEVELFNVFFKSEAQKEECRKRLEGEKSVYVTNSMGNNLEFTPIGVNKGIALCDLCQKLKIKKEEILAVGDSKNDISMFSFAALSFATANAMEQAKEKADFVICSNEENIIGNILKIIEEK